MKQIILQ